MGFAEIIELIKGVLAFPTEILAIIRIFKTTPAENRAKITARIQADQLLEQQTGRPQ